MKKFLIFLLSFCALTAQAQTDNVRRNKPTTSVPKPKPATPAKPAAKPKPAPAKPSTPKPQQPAKPTRSPQELRTETFTVNGVSFKMCYVKGGSFLMGATTEPRESPYKLCIESPPKAVGISAKTIGSPSKI